MQEATLVTRRTLLQASAVFGASALAIGGAVAPGETACADDASNGSGPGTTRYGFLVDITRCVNCELCIEACRKGNYLSDDTPNRRHTSVFTDTKGKEFSLSTSCMHCAEPSCAQVCPAGAITKGEAGIVSVNKELCIGCKYCFQACPYEVPRYNSVAMDKCDCCLGAGVSAGETPYCVRACKFDALRYGSLEDLMASTNGTAVPIATLNDPSCLVVGKKG